ncbi:MAG: DNA methyltransferase [Opitutaceae bacterium]|nr:DNA methyltransferase [Opitutaceae bacterium]
MQDYENFIKTKVRLAESWGFEISEDLINPALKPHQKAIVRWAVAGGRRAIFASIGLGKTVIELEIARIFLLLLGQARGVECDPRRLAEWVRADALGMPHEEIARSYGVSVDDVRGALEKGASPCLRALITLPLGVRQEFIRDAIKVLGWAKPPKFIRSIEEAQEPGIYLTNYETVRDGKLDPAEFVVGILDEAAILRGFGGSKTFRELMRLCTGDGGPSGIHRKDGKRQAYRFVATATPSPNEFIELLAYSEFLGIMDISQAKTRFFKRDSTKADNLTIHPHKEREFWLWMASWSMFIQRPSDLGFSDEGYALPEMEVHWHEVETDHAGAGHERSGQAKLFRDAAIGVQDAAAEKRQSLPARIQKMMEIRSETGAETHRLIWHDLEDERRAIEQAIPDVRTAYGAQDLDEREATILRFSDGEFQELATKPVIAGSGCNFQRFCAHAIYLGIGFKFADFIQSIHRIQRFLQKRKVRIDIIYTEAEREVRKQLERKWSQHNQMVQNMTQIIKEFGLSHAAMAQTLIRKLGVDRVEASGKSFRMVNQDCVRETREMATDSVGLILTSIPFSTQYEYSPNYADFGHSEGNKEFFQQMDYLTPELLRVLKPGRIAAVHVKDRIVPGGMTGLGYQTVYPFHVDCIQHYTRHGFGYMGMITIVTDVVRENNQTYRLGWTEQCKDGTKMGVGMPEYLLLFRKRPTDTANSYADEPVVKSKQRYTRSRWQIDAHGFHRSNGNRLLMPEEVKDLAHDQIFQLFKQHSLENVYNFEQHVKIAEALELTGKLPVTFMLLQPQSWAPDVWSDITRMLTMNTLQVAKGREMHLCPMQFDIADRTIERFSNPGDIVYDPFAGIGTVPYRAVLQGRQGMGCELNPTYWADAAAYLKAAEEQMSMPTLFDLKAGDAA